MKILKQRRGLVAILDGLLAYTVAFVAIGLIVLLMGSTIESDIASTKSFNLWAEDIADVIAKSMVEPSDPDNAYFSDTLTTIEQRLEDSILDIANKNDIIVDVQIEDGWGYRTGSIETAEDVVVSNRFLMDFILNVGALPNDPSDDSYTPDSTLKLLTVKVGR